MLGQDEASSDVYGMNKVAYVAGNVDRQFSLDDVAGAVSTSGQAMVASYPSGCPTFVGVTA